MARKPVLDLPKAYGATPPEFEDVVVWVAWLYYVDELTQNEIADILKVSRATIVKLLQEARERGVVSIRINPSVVSRTRLARALVERFGLAAATVIPAQAEADLVSRLGDAGARILADQLESGDVVGVAWGRTVLAAAQAIAAPSGIERLTVVQVSGSSTGAGADFSPELCSSLLAGKLSARCVNLLAPAVLSTAALRAQLLAEPALMRQFELIHSATKILFGVGHLGAGSTVRAAGYVSDAVVDDYIARGAVAVLIGRFIDRNGAPVPGALDHRMIGITLDEIRTVPVRIGVTGGAVKVEAISAALNGGYLTHLVTDIATAEALMKP